MHMNWFILIVKYKGIKLAFYVVSYFTTDLNMNFGRDSYTKSATLNTQYGIIFYNICTDGNMTRLYNYNTIEYEMCG